MVVGLVRNVAVGIAVGNSVDTAVDNAVDNNAVVEMAQNNADTDNCNFAEVDLMAHLDNNTVEAEVHDNYYYYRFALPMSTPVPRHSGSLS